MFIILRYVGRGVSPRWVTRELGGEPDQGCLLGDLIEVTEADGRIVRKPALSGFWRRTIELEVVGSGKQALTALCSGLTTDLKKWVKLSQTHRCDVAITDAPQGTMIESVFTPEDLEFLSSRGLRVNIYFAP